MEICLSDWPRKCSFVMKTKIWEQNSYSVVSSLAFTRIDINLLNINNKILKSTSLTWHQTYYLIIAYLIKIQRLHVSLFFNCATLRFYMSSKIATPNLSFLVKKVWIIKFTFILRVMFVFIFASFKFTTRFLQMDLPLFSNAIADLFTIR